MTKAWVICAVGLATIAAAPAAPLRFGLECRGMETITLAPSGRIEMPPTRREAIKSFRVDLVSRRWCADECSQTRGIKSITRSALLLVQGEVEPDRTTHITINRESGRMVLADNLKQFSIEMTGFCVRKPFTRFPSAKF